MANAENRKPELGPVRGVHRAAVPVEHAARFHHNGLLRVDADEPQGCIVEGGAEDGTLAFDVQAPAALGVGAGEEVVADFGAVGGLDRCVCYDPGDDDSWEKEHGSAIFAAPVSGGELEFFEEGEAVFDGV